MKWALATALVLVLLPFQGTAQVRIGIDTQNYDVFAPTPFVPAHWIYEVYLLVEDCFFEEGESPDHAFSDIGWFRADSIIPETPMDDPRARIAGMFDPLTDRILLSADFPVSMWTLSHEIGHYLRPELDHNGEEFRDCLLYPYN